ncbi:MAG: M67 family peptidase [Gammaproteobacteria bacterium]|nr:MAG: M67 family peptidase [Gammaproteobacteria bacterium]
MNKPPHSIILPRPLVNDLLMAAQLTPDKEICGLIASNPAGHPVRHYPIRNCAKTPQTHYRMDAGEQIRAFKTMRDRGETLFGIYHSHPKGPDHPSLTDIREAEYRDAIYFIISMNTKGVLELGAFRIMEDDFLSLPLVIT